MSPKHRRQRINLGCLIRMEIDSFMVDRQTADGLVRKGLNLIMKTVLHKIRLDDFQKNFQVKRFIDDLIE